MTGLFTDLAILMAAVWVVAILLRPLGLPTIMGELLAGVLLGPLVLGWIEPTEIIRALAEIGIFFLMFHAGVETQPRAFFAAMKRSMGVAVVGAVAPFLAAFLLAQWYGMSLQASVFLGLTMTATAVVVTLKALNELGMGQTRVARVVVASCVIDDMLTLVAFSVVLSLLSGETVSAASLALIAAKVVLFFAVSLAIGYYIYPRLRLPFRSPGGKGFTFVLVAALAAGLFAHAIGLHIIIGAYLAGLFFEEKVAHPNLVRVVKDRSYGIAYSFLGPIFFMYLGFEMTFDIGPGGVWFVAALVTTIIVVQILSAGGMARRIGMTWKQSVTVGVGMCGRAEMAFILAAIALSEGAFTQAVFSKVIFTAFILSLFTPLALKVCAQWMGNGTEFTEDATDGLVQSAPVRQNPD